MPDTGFMCKKYLAAEQIWFEISGNIVLRILQKTYEIQYLYMCKKKLFITPIVNNTNHMLVITININ